MFLINDFFMIIPEIFFILIIFIFLFDGLWLMQNPIYLHKYKIKSIIRYNFVLLIPLIYSCFILICLYLNLISYCFITNQFNFYSTLFVNFFKIFIILSLMIFLMTFINDNIKNSKFFDIEFFILILLSCFGLVSIVSSFDFLMLYLSIELYSLSGFVLVSYKKSSLFSTEAGMKYFILGSFSSGLLLFGISFLYGFTGISNFSELSVIGSFFFSLPILVQIFYFLGLIFICIAFLFKFAAAPFHFWAIDVYDGAATSVTCFLSIIPKISFMGFFLIFFNIIITSQFQFFYIIFWLCSIISIIIGSFGALNQYLLKRFLIFSSVANVGFFMAPLLVNSFYGQFSMMLFLIFYCMTLFGLFFCLFLFSSAISKKLIRPFFLFSGYWNTNLFLCLLFSFFIFSLAGLPPLAGFFSKYFVFLSMISVKFFFLAFILILFSIISLYYYLSIMKYLFFDSEVYFLFLITPSLYISFILSIFFLILISFIFLGNPFILCLFKFMVSIYI